MPRTARRLLPLGLALSAACLHSAGRPVPAVPATGSAELPRYQLDVRVFPDRKRLEVDGTLRVPPAPGPRDTVTLVLDSMMHGLRVEVLEPAELAGPARLDSAGSSGRDVKWLVSLQRAAPPNAPIVFRFSFAGGQDTPAFLFYLGGDVVYASGWGTNWYPGLGDGTTRSLGTLRVRAPPSHPMVLASGARLVTVDPATGQHAFEVYVPNFFSFVAGRFVATRAAGKIPVTAYSSGPRERAADQARVAAQAIAVLQREFGRYRMDEVALVEFPDTLAGRLGFNAAGEPGFLMLKGGFFRGRPSLANYGHELGHNWWPIVTGFKRPGSIMAEAMANYAAARVIESVEGPEAAERFRRRGDPGFNEDISARFYLTHAAAGFDTALVAMREGTFPQRNMAGSKGAFVFDMLAAEVGRERFPGILAEILDRHEWGTIEVRDFVREVGRLAGRNLDWFYEQWLTRPGAPAFSSTWRQEGGRVRGTITQTAPPYRVSLPVRVTGADSGQVTAVIPVDGAKTGFSIPVPFPAARMEIDPHYRILRWTAESKARADALAPLTRAAVRRSLDAFRAAPAAPLPDLYAFEFTARLGMAQLFVDADQRDSARVHLRAALAAPSRDPERLSLVYALLAVVAKKENDVSMLRWAVESAIAADQAAGIPGASVWARGLLEPPAAQPTAPPPG